jgi:hypothetical protein
LRTRLFKACERISPEDYAKLDFASLLNWLAGPRAKLVRMLTILVEPVLIMAQGIGDAIMAR